jgi:hypothetical protein
VAVDQTGAPGFRDLHCFADGDPVKLDRSSVAVLGGGRAQFLARLFDLAFYRLEARQIFGKRELATVAAPHHARPHRPRVAVGKHVLIHGKQ